MRGVSRSNLRLWAKTIGAMIGVCHATRHASSKEPPMAVRQGPLTHAWLWTTPSNDQLLGTQLWDSNYCCLFGWLAMTQAQMSKNIELLKLHRDQLEPATIAHVMKLFGSGSLSLESTTENWKYAILWTTPCTQHRSPPRKKHSGSKHVWDQPKAPLVSTGSVSLLTTGSTLQINGNGTSDDHVPAIQRWSDNMWPLYLGAGRCVTLDFGHCGHKQNWIEVKDAQVSFVAEYRIKNSLVGLVAKDTSISQLSIYSHNNAWLYWWSPHNSKNISHKTNHAKCWKTNMFKINN